MDLGADGAGSSVSAEQKSLLEKQSFSFRPLAAAGAPSSLSRKLRYVSVPLVIFIFSLFILTAAPRLGEDGPTFVIHAVGVLALLAYPAAAAGMLVVGVVWAAMRSRVLWPAAIYWTWWPIWRLLLCIGAAYLGLGFGNYLWGTMLYPYHVTGKLQAYSNIDPSRVQGKRLQDSGIVLFNASAGVDRSRTGCLKDGETYCVAPIALGGDALTPGLHDLFFAGVDCCTCPGEFRCGAWNDLEAPLLGGLRVLSLEKTEFFRLAAQDWAAGYSKAISNPLFFTWVSDPVAAWHELRSRAVRILLGAILLAPLVLLLLTYVLEGAFKILAYYGLAAPLEAPALPPGGIWRMLSLSGAPKNEESQDGA